MWAKGEEYEGQLRNNKLHGKGNYLFNKFKFCVGVYTYASGDSYNGEWADDKRSGRGVYTL